MATLQSTELEKILELIIKALEQNGKNMLRGFENVDKKQLAQDVASQLQGRINLEDLKNDKEMQKMLGLVIIFQALSRKFPEHQFEYQKFFEKKIGKAEIKNDLKDELKKLFLAMNELTNNPKHQTDPKKIDEYVEQISEKIASDHMENDSNKDKNTLSQNQLWTDSVADLYLRTLNGGDNPTIAGEVNFPITGPILGNLIGIPTQSIQATAKDTRTFMGDQGAYNPDKENAAFEATALLGAVAMGLSQIIPKLEVDMDKDKEVSSAPRPAPPGFKS
ncbi:MAG TPA: hypothetical protein VJN02_01485 [Gammaproteobacteria bacterium]|nr:hypothetical protein [Gammaproteobacteria bacterium]